jgi:hypothetical protein
MARNVGSMKGYKAKADKLFSEIVRSHGDCAARTAFGYLTTDGAVVPFQIWDDAVQVTLARQWYGAVIAKTAVAQCVSHHERPRTGPL